MKTFIYTTAGQSSGRQFVLTDDVKRTVVYGNTAATSVDFSADITIEVKSIRELRDTFHDLLAYGYKEAF